VTFFALGMLTVLLAGLASHLLGDNHPGAIVLGKSWGWRLAHIRPDPMNVTFGLPIGLLLPWIVALPLAVGASIVYDWAVDQDRDPEDVRDVLVGTVIGAIARALV
jgi:hypothetical protein